MQRLLIAFVVACVPLLHIIVAAQQVTPNVNVLAGTDPRTGDAFLQRQNEAVVAVSTRNSDHIIVAMNDYRTVDVAFDTTPPGQSTPSGFISRAAEPGRLTTEAVRAQAPPEAWIGLAFSRDRGRTFYNALLPGYPQEPENSVGRQSPLYGDSAGSDPVLVTGQNGRVYLIALTFDRGGTSRISATRYTDRNNVEGGEPFYFDFTRQIDRGPMSSKGIFHDKPSAAAHAGSAAGSFSTSGVAKKKKQVTTIPGCERVYAAYTSFEGNDASGNFRSTVHLSSSASCGDQWTNPVKISGPYTVNGTTYPGTRNQGTTTAVDPDTGDVYVVWRTYDPDGMVFVRSTDGGQTFSSPKPLFDGAMHVYDQRLLSTGDGENAVTFRSSAYPWIGVYHGKLIAVWSERVALPTAPATPALPDAGGWPRIVMTVGTLNVDGSVTWTPRRAVDLGDPAAGLNTRCEQAIPAPSANQVFTAPVTVCRPTGAQLMPFVTAREGQIAVSFYEARSDGQAFGGIASGTGLISGMQRQVDVRGALVALNEDPATFPANPFTTSTTFQISRYVIDSSTGRIVENMAPHVPPELKARVNYANLPMYRGGTSAFIGDYLHGIVLRPDGGGPGFRFVFTSNELVDPPPGLDFTLYDPPHQGTPSDCNPGSRNSTIMTAEVGTGLVLGSPGTFKQLVSANQPVQRAFAVYLENHTPGHRAFQLSFEGLTAGTTASFEQFAHVPTVQVDVLGSSSITRTVYLTPTNANTTPTGSVVVRAGEIADPNPNDTVTYAVTLNLSATLTLNADPTNPFVGGPGGNPDLATAENHAPQISSPQLGSPQLGSPQISSPQLGSPQLGSPQLGSPQLGSPQISSPQLGSTAPTDPSITDITYQIVNGGNTASGYDALVSLANAPHLASTNHTFQVFVYRVHQSAAVNGCAVGKAQQDQLIFQTPQLGSPQLGSPQLGSPQLGSPQLGSPQLGSPQLGSPQLGSPQLASASFSVSPADPTPDEHDGTEHQHQSDDALRLTVRVFHPAGEDVAVAHPDLQQEFGSNFSLAVQAQAVDVVGLTPVGTQPEGSFFDQIAPETTILSQPPAQTGSPSATFTFASTDNLTSAASSTFRCSLDGSAFVPCSSPITYPALAAGSHTFSVAAVDQAGNVDPTPSTAAWQILAFSSSDIIVSGGSELRRYSGSGAYLGTVGTLPAGGCAHGFDIAASGEFYIADPCLDAVHKMTTTGVTTTVHTWQPTDNVAPIALVVDHSGNLIVGDNRGDRLFKITLPSVAVSTFAPLPGPSPDTLQDISLRRGPSGTIVAAYDSYADTNDSALISFSVAGVATPIVAGPGTPSRIGGLTLTGAGNFIITDFVANQVLEVTPAGAITVLMTDEALCCNVVGLDGDLLVEDLVATINQQQRLIRIRVPGDGVPGLVTELNTTDVVTPSDVRFYRPAPPPAPGVTGGLTFNTVENQVGTWTHNVAQTFELVVDLDNQTTTLLIDGDQVQAATSFLNPVTSLSGVGMNFGFTSTQRAGWDDVTVTSADGNVTLFSADFSADTVGSPPGAPTGGSWQIANSNGSVLVRSSSGNLLTQPVELAQFGGTNSVSLNGLLAAAPTSGVWRVRWRSVMADPGVDYPSNYVYITVVGAGGHIAVVEYR